MENFLKFFTGTTGVMLAIGLCVVCSLVAIGAFCLLSGRALISVVGTPTP